METFKAAYGTAEDWAHAAQACVDGLGALPRGANLGFVYVTDVLSEDIQLIHAYLQSHTGIELWTGSIGMGVLANEGEFHDMPAIAVLVGAFPENAFHILASVSNEGLPLVTETETWLSATTPMVGVIHGDPENGATADIVRDLGEKTGTFLVGGITSSREANHQIAGRATGGGVSGVLFSADVLVATGLSQGCAPLGERHLISDCVDNVIVGLDGRKALDVFKEDIGDSFCFVREMASTVGLAVIIEISDAWR